MSYIVNLPEELKKEFRVDRDGKTSCSIRGLARMFLIDHKTLHGHFGGGRSNSFLLKTLIEQGFDLGAVKSWSETGVPDVAIPTVAQYYAFDATQVSVETRNVARNFIRATSGIGVRYWVQQELGYNKEGSADTLVTQVSLMVKEQLQPILDKIEQQTLMLEASQDEKDRLATENHQLSAVNREVDRYPHFRKLLEEAMHNISDTDYMEGITCKDYIIKNLIPLDHSKWITVSRRTAHYFLSTKGYKPEKRGNHNIYKGKDVAFIKATIAIVCQGL